MASTADFKNGMCIEFNNDLYTIVEFQHVKPGKGGAFVRTKLKGIRTGKVIDHTFNSGVKVTTARIERRPHQFLYKDDLGFHFMDTSTYEQLSLPCSLVNYQLSLTYRLSIRSRELKVIQLLTPANQQNWKPELKFKFHYLSTTKNYLKLIPERDPMWSV